MAGSVEELLDSVAALKERGDLAAHALGEAGSPTGVGIALLVGDRTLRPEHRARVYEDLVANRERIAAKADPRLVELIRWSEHVESLHAAYKRGRLQEFHYARALEATCRRCGFELLPVLGRMADLGKAWGGRDFAATWEMLSPDVVEIETPGEPPDQLGA